MCFYEVKKGWKLKKEWSEKDAETARDYARALWTFGGLRIVNGAAIMPSDFDGRLAFTSSSDVAALLRGIAIDEDGRPVSVWDVYKNGDEVGTVYACGAHWVYIPAGGSV